MFLDGGSVRKMVTFLPPASFFAPASASSNHHHFLISSALITPPVHPIMTQGEFSLFSFPYLIFVISFTLAGFSKTKFYIPKND